jgi:hypothetical protein
MLGFGVGDVVGVALLLTVISSGMSHFSNYFCASPSSPKETSNSQLNPFVHFSVLNYFVCDRFIVSTCTVSVNLTQRHKLCPNPLGLCQVQGILLCNNQPI